MTIVIGANVAASGANAASAAVQPNPASAAQKDTQSVQPAAALKADTVKLSLAANIKLLYHQGRSPSAIASTLGISVKQVNGYIPGASSTIPTAATPQAAPVDTSMPAAATASNEAPASQTPAPQLPATPGEAAAVSSKA
jgi:hypothetical protein